MKPLNKNPILPPRLKPGDTIGIVAAAGPFDVDIFDRGIHTLKAMGFQIHIPDDIYERDGYLAGSDQQRVDVIHRLFADPDINAIVCAKGGYGSLRLLSLLDYQVIEQHPKIFMGHSDISQAHQSEQGDQDESEQRQAHSPVFSKEQSQHAEEQKRVAQHLDHKLGEEVG